MQTFPAAAPAHHVRELHYHLLDVFTREAFGGNQLAVFTDQVELPAGLMQRIARELNLSETVFLLPPAGRGVARLRIFTPGIELPFAGHPTIGTACLLASLGRIGEVREPARDAPVAIILEEAAGDVHVLVRPGDDATPPWAQLTAAQPLEVRSPEATAEQLAGLLRIAESDVAPGGGSTPAPVAASCGVPFHFIPVRTVDALARCTLDMAEWESHIAATWAPHVFVYAITSGATLRGRMFGPGMGITEDNATGAAGTALAGLLARQAGADGTHAWALTQGVEMGRPSLLELEADVTGGTVTACRVGGHAIRIGEGTLRLPAGVRA